MKGLQGLELKRVVEVKGEHYGSGYRIGESLILTSSHLLKVRKDDNSNDYSDSCEVWSRRLHLPPEQRKRIIWKANVLWLEPEVDLALVEIDSEEDVQETDSLQGCKKVEFGKLSSSSEDCEFNFCFFGWPDWHKTKIEGIPNGYAGGRPIRGEILLEAYSYRGLFSLGPRPEDSPSEVQIQDAANNQEKETQHSPWQGASGAAVLCDGVIVGVLNEHQRSDRAMSLEATPISKAFENQRWRELLEKYDINTALNDIFHRVKGIAYGSNNRKYACSSMDIWNLHEAANPACKEILIIGGMFGEVEGIGYDYGPDIEEFLDSLLSNGVNISVVLQDKDSQSCNDRVDDLNLNKEALFESLHKLESIYESLKIEYSDSYERGEGIKTMTVDLFDPVNFSTIPKHGLFPNCVFNVNNSARSYSASIQSILNNRFREDLPKRYLIYECSIENLNCLFDGETEQEKFDEVKKLVYRTWRNG